MVSVQTEIQTAIQMKTMSQLKKNYLNFLGSWILNQFLETIIDNLQEYLKL